MAKIIVAIPTKNGLIFLRGVDFDKKEITMNGNPTNLTRVEKFMIEDNKKVITQSYYFPIEYLIKLCYENNCMGENGELKNVLI